MLQLPVPAYIALTLFWLLIWATRRSRDERWPSAMRALIALCALQSLVVALAQHYGLAAAQAVQPLLAACVPATAWLAFLAGTRRTLEPRTDGWHALGPFVVLLATLLQPGLLDGVIPVLYAAYALALLRSLHRHADGLPLAPLEHGEVPRRVWQLVAMALLLSASSDVLIVVDQILGDGHRRLLLISLFSSLTLLAIGVVATARQAHGRCDTKQEQRTEDPSTAHSAAASARHDAGLAAEDEALLLRLERLMREGEPFRDPDLTLTRLARRLGVPAKRLSGAINRQHGENVSRHVNRYRIERARAALSRGETVTSAMLDSGFATRSNFNREFLRITGTSPTQWRQSAHSP